LVKLIHIEFLKLRRRKLVWLMLLAALFMPVLGVFYFTDMGKVIEAMTFYKWAAFSYTQWIILPVVLGILCTMLMYEENRNDTLAQLWIVPISKLKLFISKLAIILIYSLSFMAITAIISLLCAVSIGCAKFSLDSSLFLFGKCLEVGILAAFSMLPILAVATAGKGYILPICMALIYAFLGFILLMINMYLHPLSSMSAIVSRDIPGVVLNQALNIPVAFLCIALWGVASVIFANTALKARM